VECDIVNINIPRGIQTPKGTVRKTQVGEAKGLFGLWRGRKKLEVSGASWTNRCFAEEKLFKNFQKIPVERGRAA